MRSKIIIVALIMTVSVVFVLPDYVKASEFEIVEQDNNTVSEASAASVPETAESMDEAAPSETGEAVAPSERKMTLEKATDDTPLPAVTSSKKSNVKPLPEGALKGIGEPTKYTLGPDDVIEITVRRHPEFSGEYPINSEGKIQYKFVGDIELSGLTKTEVKDKIAEILSKFIINPEVEVTIIAYRSKVIYVIGEVGAPGKYYMRADKISVREAVVQAGLPQLSAAMRRTELVRPDKSGKPKAIRIDLYALLYEGKLNLDRDMYSGDVLVVPATLFAKIARLLNPISNTVDTSGDLARRAYTGGI